MKWQKPSQQLIDTFNCIVPEGTSIEKRKMFGYPCSFVNNNMFMGLYQEGLFLRLSEQDRERFLQLEKAQRFEPMPGRIMKEYVVVPSWMIKETTLLQDWVKRSLEYVSGLPPKVKKKKRKNESEIR